MPSALRAREEAKSPKETQHVQELGAMLQDQLQATGTRVLDSSEQSA